MINLTWHKFANLNICQLYSILTLRSDVFVVEQQCAYLDPDGKDEEALHLLGEVNGTLAAYLRLFPPTNNPSSIIFGRVVTARHARTHGYGKQLLKELLSYCNNYFPHFHIECSAQLYLKKFYEGFGFTAQGDVYNEDNIPHIALIKK
jgi:ElaA protein